MKKIFFLSTGILLLAAILISGGCNCSANGQGNSGKKEITIQLRAVIQDGKKRLKLFDSEGNIATDYLVTGVHKGDKIIWKLKGSSNIDKIVRIYSPEKESQIFKQDAQQQGSANVFTLIIPDDVIIGTLEKYNIRFIYKDSSEVIIDPYIRIEP